MPAPSARFSKSGLLKLGLCDCGGFLSSGSAFDFRPAISHSITLQGIDMAGQGLRRGTDRFATTLHLHRSPAISQVTSGQAICQGSSAVPVRFSSEVAGPSLKGDEFLKNTFLEVKKKFETALGILRKEKVTIDPDDPNAVSRYGQIMRTVREKEGLYSDVDRVKYIVRDFTEGIPNVRSYLKKLIEIRVKSGLEDHLGAEKMMMDALEKVEKLLNKLLMRDDKNGMALLLAEFNLINKKQLFSVYIMLSNISDYPWIILGISGEDLPKYEKQLELDVAKVQLEGIKKDAEEAIETQKKREGSKADDIVIDVRTLDLRNYL